jgi:sialic acid synthase SpsE
MKNSIKLGKKEIRKQSSDFYFIAEIGTNYVEVAEQEKKHPLEIATQMVRTAALAGVDAIKFQIYNADGLASKEEAPEQYEYLRKHHVLTFEDYGILQAACEMYKVEFMATLFTEEAIQHFSPKLNILKVASPDINNKPILKKLGSYKKPIILSTAGADLEEIGKAIDWIGHNEVVIMHCSGTYPTEKKDINFGMIKNMNDFFPNVIGYSDHVKPETLDFSPVCAFLVGANILEKHFTLNRALTNNDHIHSYSPTYLSLCIEKLKEAQEVLGCYHKKPIEAESDFRLLARRSLSINRDINEGEIIQASDIVTLRPGTGIPPSQIENVVGKIARKKIDKNSILYYNIIR